MQGVSQMMDPSGTYPSEQVQELLTGDRHAAMEAAKRLIRIHEQVKPEQLIRVLENRTCHLWSRIAAAYVLGFLEYSSNKSGIAALLRVLKDSGEPVLLRSHAAEALSNLGATEAVPVLKRVQRNSESPSLQKWCRFALSEIESGR
jgi:HEAT repeat protein